MLTYFVVQSFTRGKRGVLLQDQAAQATSREHAARMAERLSRTKAGVVAFSRTGDPLTGDFDDAQIISAFGSLPDEVSSISAAA